MRVYEDSDRVTQIFDSVADLAETVRGVGLVRILRDMDKGREDDYIRDFYGGVTTREELFALARDGWFEKADETLTVSESVVAQVERIYDLPTWQARYDVAGADVDVARYLSGEPENMITFDPVPTPTSGRVVALLLNVSTSGRARSGAIIRRGQAVAALVHSLETSGMRTEVYVEDWTRVGRTHGRVVVRVKASSDALDPAVLLAALAHPAMTRGMLMAALHALPSRWQDRLGIGGSYGAPGRTLDTKHLPEGTVVIDASLDAREDPMDGAGVREFVIRHLKDLGLI